MPCFTQGHPNDTVSEAYPRSGFRRAIPRRHIGDKALWATGITPITQKKLLFALAATFIIRPVSKKGDFRGSALYFEDHSEVAVLSQDRLSADQRWTGLILRNLREQISYRLGENADLFQYRTRAGVVVPFAWRTVREGVSLMSVRW